jgi:hypothetical protein
MAKPQDLHHQYDDPSINGEQFLLAVMHDRSLPLAIRVDAADRLLPLYQEPRPVQTITITGGLPKELANIEARSSDVFDWRDRRDATANHWCTND